jgi:predicted Fe-S protein YdhL (DUF1289 family)
MRVVRLNSRPVRDAFWPLLDDDIQACKDLPDVSDDDYFELCVRVTGEQTSWMRMTEAEREEIRPRRRLRLVTGTGSIGDERQAAA